MDIRQVKRRGGRPTSLRTHYQEDGANGPITITGEGPVEDQETIIERAQGFVSLYLTNNGTSPTGLIVKAAEAEKIPDRTTRRALKQLVDLGLVHKPMRGYYSLAEARRS
jgi:hypothetical protein